MRKWQKGELRKRRKRMASSLRAIVDDAMVHVVFVQIVVGEQPMGTY